MTSSLNNFFPQVSSFPESVSFSTDMRGKNPVSLLHAVQSGDLEFLQENLSHFPPEIINIVIDGETLLSAAIKKGSVPIICYLIQNKARLDLKDSHQLSPLDYATLSSQSHEILPVVLGKWISRDKAQISAYLNDASLMKAAQKSLNQLKIDTNLINESRVINLIKTYLVNPSQREEVINLLYETINDPLDQNGNTILHLLVNLSLLAPQVIHHLFKSLLEKGVNPNIGNFFGQTPMHSACAQQSFLINLLSEHQADFFQLDHQGIPPVALISAESLKKDPLKLDSSEVILAAFIVINQLTKSFYNPGSAEDLIAGLITVPELVNYGFLLSQWAVLVKKKGIASLIPSITASVLIHALLNGLSMTEGKHLVPMLSALPIGIIIASSFKSLKETWKHKGLKPYKALRNMAVHSINFSHALYESANMINNLANHIWHTSYNRYDEVKEVDLELKRLENATAHIKEQIKGVSHLSGQSCLEDSLSFNKGHCEELTCIKDRYLEIEQQLNGDLAYNEEKLQKLIEEFESKTILKEFWNFITSQKSPEQLHLEILKINPFSKEFKTNPEQVLKRQYHKLSLQMHPDKCSEDMKKICEEQFAKITAAHNFFQPR